MVVILVILLAGALCNGFVLGFLFGGSLPVMNHDAGR